MCQIDVLETKWSCVTHELSFDSPESAAAHWRSEHPDERVVGAVHQDEALDGWVFVDGRVGWVFKGPAR